MLMRYDEMNIGLSMKKTIRITLLLLSLIHNPVDGLLLLPEEAFHSPSPTTGALSSRHITTIHNRRRRRPMTLINEGYRIPYFTNHQMHSSDHILSTTFHRSTIKSASRIVMSIQRQDNNNNNNNKDDEQERSGEEGKDDERLLQGLQNELLWIEAIEERNKAQLDSFIDVQDQWESLDIDEKELLLKKQSIMDAIEQLMTTTKKDMGGMK
jgi:hypothetical protein